MNNFDQYRRPKDQPLGWRAWFGTDVVCRDCGCVLNTLVHHCPDCGGDNWQRSKLHTLGHRLRVHNIAMVITFAFVLLFAVPFLLGLAAIPPILLLVIFGQDEPTAVWNFAWYRLGFIIGFMVLEVAVWLIWNSGPDSRTRRFFTDGKVGELWKDWWKPLGLIALGVCGIAFVFTCQRVERQTFLDCLDDNIPYGETLYYADDAFYDQVDRYDAIDAAKECYDERGITDEPAERY